MHHDATRADGRSVADFNRADNDAVAPDIHAVADDRTIVRTLAHADRRGVTQCAIGSDDSVVMDDERVTMIKPEPRTDRGLVIQLDAQLPIHEELVNSQIWETDPPHAARQPVQFLREAERGQHQTAADVAGVGGPILQDALTHLTCVLRMTVFFYLPETHLPSAEKRAAWTRGEYEALEEEGKTATAQSWIYRTWLALSQSGCRAELVHALPESGYVIALTGTIPPTFRAPEELFLADVVADGLPHPAAHLHIVQNAAHARRLPRAIFMTHWPQPGLVRRDKARGTKFERVAFFGTKQNLAPELRHPAWLESMGRATGCAFEIRGAERWHDYSDVDAVVAARDFRGGRQLHKPATKLYNAWLAGVPFIGGTDSACAAEGNAGRDYLVARSPDEVIAHLEKLKSDEALRRSLVEQGNRRAANYTVEATTALWRKLIEETIPAIAEARAGRARWLNLCGDLAMRGICAADRVFRS